MKHSHSDSHCSVDATTPKAPLASAPPSLLMASAGQRLLGTAALLAVLWAAVAWALRD